MNKDERINIAAQDARNFDKAKEPKENPKLRQSKNLSLLEKLKDVPVSNTQSKGTVFSDDILSQFERQQAFDKTEPKTLSLYDKNIYVIRELYEARNSKKALENETGTSRNSPLIFKDKNEARNINEKVQRVSKTLGVSKKIDPRMKNGFPLTTTLNFDNEKLEIPLLTKFSDSSFRNDDTIFVDQNQASKNEIQTGIKFNKYVMMRTIGRGNFAKVKLAKHMSTEKLVAIKIIDKTQLNEKILSKIGREVTIMKQLNHPNIVKLFEVIENASTLYMVMEYASGGELFDYLIAHGCMKEKEARVKFRQMVSAVHYCHCKSIVHRDLKAENMLLNNKMEIKIADFGFANTFSKDSTLDTFCGSPPYAAPELFQGHRYIGPEIDVWSLGIILFTLVSGRLPFDGSTLKELKEKVLNLRYEFPYFISSDCENLLKKMLTVSPKSRATLESIINDPWVNGEGLSKLTPYLEIPETVLDERRVKKMSILGYERNDILKSIINKKFNALYATYYLIGSSSSHTSHKKSDEVTKKAQTVSEKSELYKSEWDSITELDKSYKDVNLYNSLTGGATAQFAKSVKKLFTKKHDNSETLPVESTPDSLTAASMSKEFHKQLQIIQSMDPNQSLTKGSNQQALLATFNQMSWSKSAKAAMFQHQILGSTESASKLNDKRPMAAVPTIMGSDNFTKKSHNESTALSKFTVQNVKATQASDPLIKPKFKQFANEINENRSIASSNKKGNILPLLSQSFSKLKKNNEEDKSDKESKDRKVKPSIFSKDDSERKKATRKIFADDNSEKSERSKISKKLVPSFVRIDDIKKSKKHKDEHLSDIVSPNIKPRNERFAFSMNTISSKDPDFIMQEIIRVLKENDFNYEYVEKYLLLCWNITAEHDNFTDSIQWEIEVCRLPLLFMHGVRMKRIFGSSFAYKNVAMKITKSMKL